MEELLKQILQKLTDFESNMATKDDIAEIISRLDRIDSNQNEDLMSILHTINSKVTATHERLDFQRLKVAALEEEIHLFKHKQ